MLPENFTSLHKEEEQIRVDSLRLIERDVSLSDHLAMIHESMDIIYALAHDHDNTTEDELTIQYLGLRLFNSAASSLKLSLSGYYQSAVMLLRDVFETVALLDYMRTFPDQIAVWKASDKRQRIAKFSPKAIREALDKQDQFTSNRRKEMYDLLSEYASHATAPGFKLLAPEGLGKIGPFLSEKCLKAWLGDAVKFLVHGATIFTVHFLKVDLPLLTRKGSFLNHVNNWCEKYMSGPK